MCVLNNCVITKRWRDLDRPIDLTRNTRARTIRAQWRGHGGELLLDAVGIFDV